MLSADTGLLSPFNILKATSGITQVPDSRIEAYRIGMYERRQLCHTTVKPRFTAQFGGTEKGAVNRGKR